LKLLLLGGIQAFPSNLTMIGLIDLQQQQPQQSALPPPPSTVIRARATATTTIDLPDCCFICKQQKRSMMT